MQLLAFPLGPHPHLHWDAESVKTYNHVLAYISLTSWETLAATGTVKAVLFACLAWVFVVLALAAFTAGRTLVEGAKVAIPMKVT